MIEIKSNGDMVIEQGINAKHYATQNLKLLKDGEFKKVLIEGDAQSKLAIDPVNGSTTKFLNEKGEFVTPDAKLPSFTDYPLDYKYIKNYDFSGQLVGGSGPIGAHTDGYANNVIFDSCNFKGAFFSGDSFAFNLYSEYRIEIRNSDISGATLCPSTLEAVRCAVDYGTPGALGLVIDQTTLDRFTGNVLPVTPSFSWLQSQGGLGYSSVNALLGNHLYAISGDEVTIETENWFRIPYVSGHIMTIGGVQYHYNESDGVFNWSLVQN